jgi:hypothetical protein
VRANSADALALANTQVNARISLAPTRCFALPLALACTRKTPARSMLALLAQFALLFFHNDRKRVYFHRAKAFAFIL